MVHVLHVRRLASDSEVPDRFEALQHPLPVDWECAVIVGRGHRTGW
jgi:hypothetical protein